MQGDENAMLGEMAQSKGSPQSQPDQSSVINT